MRQFALLLVITVPLAALALVAGSVLRPRLRSLPAPAEAIDARWESARPWMPDPQAGDADALNLALAALPDTGTTAPDVASLAEWFDAHGELPGTGCPIVASLTGDAPAFQPAALLLASRGLLDADRADVVFGLAAQLRQRDVASLLIGTAMVESALEEAFAPGPAQMPKSEELFAAIAHEAACADKVFDAAPFRADSFWVRWHFAPAVERRILRWNYAELLHGLHPVRHDATKMAAVVDHRAANAQSLENTVLAGMLAAGPLRASREYLHTLGRLGAVAD